MVQRMKAIFRDGAFYPESPCDFPPDSHVELTVEGPTILPPVVTDPDERRRRLRALVERMQANPIPPNAPARFTREELHERR